MDFNFELYEDGERKSGRTIKGVYVTLGKDGRIYFSGRAVEALGECEVVGLMFDVRRQVIGVMPVAADRKHAYQLRTKRGLGAGRTVTARNFCEHYAIKPVETVRFVNASVNGDGILILDLQVVESASRKLTVNGEQRRI